ncbi:hypothetical protein [Streptomyces sp. NPDC056361]|uniref:hypothetical protein n=1 Tax=Streptomyces sp. NPDC056361 TaxID=3345795 RepID=UPI0035D6220D
MAPGGGAGAFGAVPPWESAPVGTGAREAGRDESRGAGTGTRTASGTGHDVAARRAAGLDDEGFLRRVRRRAREADGLGVVATLLLLLIPAAVAAALLGNRGK